MVQVCKVVVPLLSSSTNILSKPASTASIPALAQHNTVALCHESSLQTTLFSNLRQKPKS